MAVAPFQVAVVVAQADDATVAAAGERIYRGLLGDGIEAIIDDRAERAGVKFRDVELVGIPLRITVGRRTLADGLVELTDRASGRTDNLPLRQVVEMARKAIDSVKERRYPD
jgi:prolyl-tRNA synthetase